MNYAVGQILYVVLKNDNKVVPMQISEEITRKTLDGLKIDYIVKVGSDDKKTTMTVAEIDGDIFESPEQAIEVLTEKAKTSIIRLVNLAQDKAKVWYDLKPAKILHDPEQESEVLSINGPSSKERVKIRLPDGTIANVQIPDQTA